MTTQRFEETVLPFIKHYYFDKKFVMNSHGCSLGNVTISYSPFTFEWEIVISQSATNTIEGKGSSLEEAYINLLGFNETKRIG